jgi:hypothetical protein
VLPMQRCTSTTSLVQVATCSARAPVRPELPRKA